MWICFVLKGGALIKKVIVPRAIYYMDLKTAMKSVFKVFLGKELKASQSVDEFEQAMERELGRSVVTMPNARYGLLRTLEYLKIGQGDGILMTPINLPDMKTIILNTGADLHFVKYCPKSFEPDFKQVKVRPEDKIFFFTPLAGIVPDMNRITEFCNRNNLTLIIDFTQSFMSSYKDRSIHLFSSYSFSSLCDLKVIHTHRGGVYNTDDEAFYKFLQGKQRKLNPINRKFFLMSIFEDAFSVFLLNPMVFKNFTRWGLKLLSFKRGDNVEAITSGKGIKILGFRFLKGFFQSNQVKRGANFPSFLNYRFSDLQAKIGLERLKKYKYYENKRIHNAELFYKSLKDRAISAIPLELTAGNSYWKSPLWVRSPKKFKAFMGRWGMDCSQTNLPLLYSGEEDATCNMRDNIVYMPTHWYLNDQQIIDMATIVNEYFRESHGE